MRKSIANLRVLSVPLGILGMIILLMLFGGKIFLDKISEQRALFEAEVNTGLQLTQKLNSLQTTESLANLADDATIALPAENPSFVVLSQIKRFAGEAGLTIDNIQVGPEVKEAEGVSRADLSFDMEGSYQNILSFQDRLSSAAPITRLVAADLSTKGADFSVSFTVSLYWADFPESLPAVSQPLVEMTPEEAEILSKLASFEKPIILGAGQAPAGSVGKPNPFQ